MAASASRLQLPAANLKEQQTSVLAGGWQLEAGGRYWRYEMAKMRSSKKKSSKKKDLDQDNKRIQKRENVRPKGRRWK